MTSTLELLRQHFLASLITPLAERTLTSLAKCVLPDRRHYPYLGHNISGISIANPLKHDLHLKVPTDEAAEREGDPRPENPGSDGERETAKDKESDEGHGTGVEDHKMGDLHGHLVEHFDPAVHSGRWFEALICSWDACSD